MDNFPINNFTSYKQIPLSELNKYNHSVYVLTFDWNYIFVNDFVNKNLGDRSIGIIGKNMWVLFPELNQDAAFLQMKKDIEAGRHSAFTTISPVTGQRLHIKGWAISDCYFFTASILPIKEDLLNELRSEMRKEALSKKNNSTILE